MHKSGGQRPVEVAGGQAAVPVVLDHVVMPNPHASRQVLADLHPGNAAALVCHSTQPFPGPLQLDPSLQVMSEVTIYIPALAACLMLLSRFMLDVLAALHQGWSAVALLNL